MRRVLNGSRGFYDAARISLSLPRWRGLSLDTAYWFSKAMDLGSSYTNTAYEGDSRISRSQSEFESHNDMRGLSTFDQPHAFLARGAWAMPAPAQSPWIVRQMLGRPGGGWIVSGVVLLKNGTPFQVTSGSDAPGFGNVDGNGADRPTWWIHRFWDALSGIPIHPVQCCLELHLRICSRPTIEAIWAATVFAKEVFGT
jgi:hypothetical protein